MQDAGALPGLARGIDSVYNKLILMLIVNFILIYIL